ncbi:DUF502 domain-containing protein [Jeongeupia naejangsanensis]|uniref:DUF502 domain-containing protein n=1 Tax=Jeongeupia naejangsanensis TaxID=613195 RepID=A0ABS2BK95_9NEIS|nr:DUF502 domain-containing protein [Jeongeupia naejangsanensis]MBM3116032.1 DUF502 domain-containing protein [Jeongeupia naejangsanensis]
MIKRSAQSILTTWLAGLLALLPLALTLALLGWVVSLLNSYVGPGSLIGRMFSAVGLQLVDNPYLAYLAGTLLLIIAIYPLGIAVQSGLKKPLAKLVDLTLRRIPLFGSLYNMADRFVGLLDQKQEADIGAMSPVWCFFGGDGVAVLALMPNPEPVNLDGRLYHAVLVPTAPVPIGGGLLYVPADWVRPANIGVDKLTSVYVSMGITPPPMLRSGKATLSGDTRLD